ncbi:MAG: pilin [Cardiobacteriaceae bacterium]|nr:pilin [Cardiobacteriaceae bacterium]
MSTTQNYYQILNIPTNATIQSIQRAVKKLKTQNKSGDFSIILNNIEHTLIDPEQRQIYDDSINLSPERRVDYEHMFDNTSQSAFSANSMKSFFDYKAGGGHESYKTEESQDSDLQHSPYRRKREDIIEADKALKFKRALPTGTLVSLILLGIVLFVGASFSQPLYEKYRTQQQVTQALAALDEAKASIESFIKKNRYFPDHLPDPSLSQGEFYKILLNSQRALELTFNEQAASSLHNYKLFLQSFNIPNLGLNWTCLNNGAFPKDYLPARCQTELNSFNHLPPETKTP